MLAVAQQDMEGRVASEGRVATAALAATMLLVNSKEASTGATVL